MVVEMMTELKDLRGFQNFNIYGRCELLLMERLVIKWCTVEFHECLRKSVDE